MPWPRCSPAPPPTHYHHAWTAWHTTTTTHALRFPLTFFALSARNVQRHIARCFGGRRYRRCAAMTLSGAYRLGFALYWPARRLQTLHFGTGKRLPATPLPHRIPHYRPFPAWRTCCVVQFVHTFALTSGKRYNTQTTWQRYARAISSRTLAMAPRLRALNCP